MRGAIFALLVGAAACRRTPASGPRTFPALESVRSMSHARLEKYSATFSAVDPKFAGVRALGAALKTGGDADALAARNPDFWRATMEMVPQDPSVAFAAAYADAAQGRLNRAEAWLLLGGIGMDDNVKPDRENLKKAIDAAHAEIAASIKQGAALHDAKKYDEAIKLYDDILAGAPEDPWALYEKSYSLLAKDQNGTEAEREELYKRIRASDPFYWQAYQGTDPDVIHRQLPTLLTHVQPFLSGKARDPQGLAQFAAGAEAMGLSDYAALAWWKLMLFDQDRHQEIAHFLYNVKQLGNEPFVKTVASEDALKEIDAIAAAAPPKLSSGTLQGLIVQYGLFRPQSPMPESSGGKSEVVKDPKGGVPVLARAADVVPAVKGALFGFSFIVAGLPDGPAPGFKSVITHPDMRCPDAPPGTKIVTPIDAQAKRGTFSGMVLYSLDAPCELLAGRWNFSVVREKNSLRVEAPDGRLASAAKTSEDVVMIAKDFDVVDPTDPRLTEQFGAAPAAAPTATAAPGAASAPKADAGNDAAVLRSCSTEIDMLCRGKAAKALRRCLEGSSDNLLPPCKKALGL